MSVDDIVAEGGDPASGYFGGQYKEVSDQRTQDNLKPCDPKHSRFSPMATVTVGFQKTVYLFR